MRSQIMGRDQMQGFLENLDRNSAGTRGLVRVQAVIDHFFTNYIFPDLAKDAGYEYAANLMDFIRLAVLSDPSNFLITNPLESKTGESK